MRLVDDDLVSAGNRGAVHGARSTVQRWDRGGHAVFTSQPSSPSVAGSDALVWLEHHRPGGPDRKRPPLISKTRPHCFSRISFADAQLLHPAFSYLQLLSTSVFKNGGYRWLYNWKGLSQSTYWSTSSREFGCMLQIIPLLIVPFAGIVQSCRYLATGPPDLFDVGEKNKKKKMIIYFIVPWKTLPSYDGL